MFSFHDNGSVFDCLLGHTPATVPCLGIIEKVVEFVWVYVYSIPNICVSHNVKTVIIV